ncbi:hypothetical protein GP486_004794, partial [Trichoglossum hirsutum]
MSHDRYERQRHHGRSGLGFWIPLAVTATAATVGLAAWIWNERRSDDDDSSYDEEREDEHHEDASTVTYSDRRGKAEDGASGGVVALMSGALRRTPSPQQLLDGASKKFAAGMAAAGTAVGGALSSIREEEKDDFADHSRWSEEAEVRRSAEGKTPERGSSQVAGPSTQAFSSARETDTASVVPGATFTTDATSWREGAPSGYYQGATRRRKAAIVVSAETGLGDHGEDGRGNNDEQASILSHLSSHIDLAVTELFVLIYAPEIKQHPLSTSSTHRPAISNTSSFSNIGGEDAFTPGEELEKPLVPLDPKPVASVSSGADTPRTPAHDSLAFKMLYGQALSLVGKKSTTVFPFTTPFGHVHILRHLGPEVVYIQESLCGENGDVVTQISSWVGQVVVVVGAEGGHGGLVDSEDEYGAAGRGPRGGGSERT